MRRSEEEACSLSLLPQPTDPMTSLLGDGVLTPSERTVIPLVHLVFGLSEKKMKKTMKMMMKTKQKEEGGVVLLLYLCWSTMLLVVLLLLLLMLVVSRQSRRVCVCVGVLGYVEV